MRQTQKDDRFVATVPLGTNALNNVQLEWFAGHDTVQVVTGDGEMLAVLSPLALSEAVLRLLAMRGRHMAEKEGEGA